RAERAVELPVGRLHPQARERVAGFARAPVELLHPLLAEPERGGKVEHAALRRRQAGELGPLEPEQLPHRGGDLVRALAAALRAEAVAHAVAIEGGAIGLAPAPPDLAHRHAA